MAEKKRPATKAKKPLQKKTPKTESLETKAAATAVVAETVKIPQVAAPEQTRNVVDGNGAHSEAFEKKIQNEPNQTNQVVPALKMKIMDEYTVQSYFDKTQRKFVAMCVEFPELKVAELSREEAVREMEYQIEDHIHELRSRGQAVTEAIQNRQYPEKLEIPLSQGLFRRLDLLSRNEKLPIDKLVVEILAAAMERRPMGANRGQPHQQHHQNNQGSHGHHNQRPRDNRGQGGGGQHNRNRGGNFGRDMERGDNFLEYVRNLEKGGPGNNNWKKR